MSRKQIWWKFHYVVHLVNEGKSFAAVGIEQIMTSPPDEIDIELWIPLSQMKGAKVTHKLENGILKEVDAVEKEKDQIIAGDHIASIKLPVWLGQEKELEPENPDELQGILDKIKNRKASDTSTLPWSGKNTDGKSEPEGTQEDKSESPGGSEKEHNQVCETEDAPIFQEEVEDAGPSVQDVLENAFGADDTTEGKVDITSEDVQEAPSEDNFLRDKDEPKDEIDPTELW